MQLAADHIFHLAIPCKDIEKSRKFYVEMLSCSLGRRYDDRITLNFFGHQVVCHLAPDRVDSEPRLYPRHFGMTFYSKQDWDKIRMHVEANNIIFFDRPHTRFDNLPEKHWTFRLQILQTMFWNSSTTNSPKWLTKYL